MAVDLLDPHVAAAPERVAQQSDSAAEIDVQEVLRACRTPRRLPPLVEPNVYAIDGKIERVSSCPVCDGTTARPALAVAGMPERVMVCTDCGLGRLYPLPTPERIAKFYPPEYYGGPGAKFRPLLERAIRIIGARHIHSLTRGLPKGARILDVGCGRGVLLGALADRGYSVHGFEISETAAAGADPRAEIRIGSTIADAHYPAASFDQVILWHVLEHLPNPREVLLEIRRILKPGGRLVVAVPNFSSLQARWAGPAWFHLDLPRHLFHFPVAGLKQLLARCGLNATAEGHFSLRQDPFGWVQSALNLCSAAPRNALYAMLKQDGGRSKQLPLRDRVMSKVAYWLGMPLGVAVSVASAVLKRGATVCVVAERTAGDGPGEAEIDVHELLRAYAEEQWRASTANQR